MATPLLQLFFIYILILLTTSTPTPSAQPSSFKCTSSLQECSSLIDYISPNATTLAAIKHLFNIKNLRSILGVNNLPLSTPPNQSVPAKQSILKIPIPCICTNGTGKSNRTPIYKVVKGDSLDRIANEVFSGLVTYQEIQDANNIGNAKLVKVGEKLWIPLPCSCDEVEGVRVVHYGHLVAENSTVEGISKEYNTTQEVILRVNGLVSVSPNDLKAGAVLDVPLKVCTTPVTNNSLDYPLLVTSGTYIFTAANCVKCTCDAANNWILQCEPSQFNSSLWPSCPSMNCQNSADLYMGNSTAYGCSRTTCSYTGYTNQTILTASLLDNTCPTTEVNSSPVSLSVWRLIFIVTAVQSLLFHVHFG